MGKCLDFLKVMYWIFKFNGGNNVNVIADYTSDFVLEAIESFFFRFLIRLFRSSYYHHHL